MFCRSPKAASEQITDEPPELSRGSGRPVTGTMRMFIPILTNTWKNIIVTTPMARILPSRSRLRMAILIPTAMIVPYNNTTAVLPINPLSSAITEKIKSLWATPLGKYPYVFCIPFFQPLPVSPPDPTEIIA